MRQDWSRWTPTQYFNETVGETVNVLLYLTMLWIYTCRALAPYYQIGLYVCFMQQGIKFTEVWHVDFVDFSWYFGLISFTQTHTHKDRQHTQGQ